jgi:hypothetical protein
LVRHDRLQMLYFHYKTMKLSLYLFHTLVANSVAFADI